MGGIGAGGGMGVGCRGKITQGCDQNTRQKASVTNQQGKINNISSDGSVWEDRKKETDTSAD